MGRGGDVSGLGLLTCVSPRTSRFSMGKRSVEEKVNWGSLGKVVVICGQNDYYLDVKHTWLSIRTS